MFWDVEGAFDNTPYNVIESAARDHGINSTIIRWIGSMLRKRILNTELKGSKLVMHPKKGCPQGGVLSPLLWNLIANIILKLLNDAGFDTSGFADDFVSLIRGLDCEVVFQLMAAALRLIENWCSSVHLKVNPAKTKLVLFTRKRNYNVRELSFFGSMLKVENTVKYLGVILDKKLDWKPHIEERSKKACMLYGQCRKVIGKKWGLRPKCIYWIYSMVIQPYLTYGSIVWWQKTELNSVKTKLNHLQRLVCLGITGALSSTPTAGMEALLGIPPLYLRVAAEARYTAYRLKKKGNWNNNFNFVGHSKIWHMISSYEKMSDANRFDGMTKKLKVGKNFTIVIPSRDDWGNLHVSVSDTIKVFTDGSFKDDQAGAGIFCDKPSIEEILSLGKYPTVFQAEIVAIFRAAELLLEKGISGKTVIILSDSQAALKALDNYWVSSLLVDSCWNILQNLGANNALTLSWVPGHSGIEGNEKADELARRGSENELIGPEPCLPLSDSFFRMRVKQWMGTRHKRIWKDLKTCEQTRDYLVEPNNSVSNAIWKLPKPKMRIVVGIITGHCLVNKHLHNLKITQSSLCDKCNSDEESAFHLVCLCPSYARLRLKVLGDHTLNLDQYRALSVNDILKFVELTGRLTD